MHLLLQTVGTSVEHSGQQSRGDMLSWVAAQQLHSPLYTTDSRKPTNASLIQSQWQNTVLMSEWLGTMGIT